MSQNGAGIDLMSKKSLLVLTSRFPYPPLSGGKLVLLNFARAVKEHRLTLLSMCATREELEFEPDDGIFAEIHKVYLPKWESYWNVLRALPGRRPLQLAYYWSDAFRQKLQELLPRCDAVLAHLIRTGQYLTRTEHNAPRVLLMSDAISLAYQRMAEVSGAPPLWHFLYRAELKRLLPFERAFPEVFDQTWLHSEIDRGFLGLNRELVRIIPLGIDLDELPFSPNRSGNVVAFIGNMSFSLNVDACQHFIRDIFPALRATGDISFRIIGACPPSVKKNLERHPGVEVTGTVRRIADAVERVFCGVCPVRGGAGIQSKILNYLALGIPCVTSEVGLEGLNAVDGHDLFVYQKSDKAIERIMRLHKDSSLRSEMAANGHRFVTQAHDWNIIYGSIRKEISTLLTGQDQSRIGLYR